MKRDETPKSSAPPTTSTGRLVADNTQQVAHPQNTDVLLGRGKRAVHWKGNVRFRNLVKRFAGEYENSSDPNKRDTVANQVMACIKETGGRFLQVKDRSNTWVAISETSARTKVKQALRDVTKTSRTKTKRSAVVLLHSDEIARQDLEPRPIEEMVRSASANHMVGPTRNLLLQQELQLRRRQSLPSEHGGYHGFRHQVAPTSLPGYPSPHQPDFHSILRRQQDILFGAMAARGGRLQQHQQQHQQHDRQQASAAMERLSYGGPTTRPPPGRDARIVDELLIGQATTYPTMAWRSTITRSEILLDEAFRQQVTVDQMARGCMDYADDASENDQSSLGSSVFDDDDDDDDDASEDDNESDRKPPASTLSSPRHQDGAEQGDK